MAGGTIFATQEGPANALALNKDYTQVVIAGRNVFKVFSIEEDEFAELCNLRVGKNLNLNFSCNDVAWNTIDDHLLATAATNGAVVVWNLNRQGRSKQEHVFIDHKRTVNKVNFHSTEPSRLISGSQDGTMKCFDLRSREVTNTFISNTESVRDVQFCPHSIHNFAAVSENGNVQLWDIRRPDRYTHQYTAHSGPVFACDWHPEAMWLATASRDKTIKVWDLSTSKPTLEYTIHTIASVGHIKWRPKRMYHIASCALVVDCSINVWDVRRPYIPFASFDEHKDVATGVVWMGDPRCFLSTSRDNTLYRHSFEDANRPATKANPQGVSLNNKGDVVYACRINVNTESRSLSNKISVYYRKVSVSSEEFHQASSTLHSFFKTTNTENNFYQCATQYILCGKPLGDMCEHNATIAKRLGKNNVHILWNIIKTLYSKNDGQEGEDAVLSAQTTMVNSNVGLDHMSTLEGDQFSVKGADTPGAAYSDETETEEVPDLGLSQLRGFTNLSLYQPGALAPRGDFIFGESELDMEFDRMSSGLRNGYFSLNSNIMETQDWTLPTEAFPLRHELQDRSPPPEQFPNHGSPDLGDDTPTVTVEDQPSSLLTVASVPKIGVCDLNPIVVELLKYHATMGDVQTAVSILLVLGERRPGNHLLDEITQEQWIVGYLEILSRHRLWDVATQVIKLSWIPNINQLNQQSTTIYTNCGQCSKPLQRTGWLCDRCHSTDCALCSVCHQVVKGLYVWCQGCSHGGHLAHMKQWMETSNMCPTGCGHLCEYS